MALLVGLTGGIGAGKSTALKELEALGHSVIDADDIVHDLYQAGSPLVEEMAARYGAEIADIRHGIDRRRLAEIAFASPEELHKLNRLVHPFVKRELDKAKAVEKGFLFCAVPLLFEVGWQCDFVCTIALWCDPQTQQERMQDRGWSRKELARRQAGQWTMDKKLELSDYGVINNGSLEMMREQLRRLVSRIERRFA